MTLELTEEVPDATGSNADEHLVELGAGGVVEGHVGLPGYSTSQKGLTRSWGANQQDT